MRETILAFVKQHLCPEDWTVVESLTDEELESNYKQLLEFSRNRDLKCLTATFHVCHVCERRVWTGVKVYDSHYHFKGNQFLLRDKDDVSGFVCCQCLDACACPDSEKKNYYYRKRCTGCAQHYCMKHNGSGELCGDCDSALWFGRRARELIQNTDSPVSWEEFCSIMRQE